jgi:ABC-type transport system involved in multi-copper enzyme maturation permease subunit
MMPSLKTEIKKLLTVRSTYFLMLGFLLLGAFFTFYVHGFRADGEAGSLSSDPLFVAGSITQIATVLSLGSVFVALLLLGNEYRYNTIVYTLTAINSRNKVLASKILASVGLVFIYSVVSTAILLPLVWAGAAAAGHSLPHQDINLLAFFAKVVFYCEAFSLVGLLFITLMRNQIGAIVTLLVVPNTVESILTLLLKKNAVYLPFTALQQVIQPQTLQGATAHASGDLLAGSLSPVKGALVFLAYLVAAWIVAWYLFLKRDAS